MWTTVSPFLPYSYVQASLQSVNHSCNDKSFQAIPNMLGFHWTKVVRALATLQVGLRPRYYQCYMNFNMFYNRQLQKRFLLTNLILVFLLLFISLSLKHNWCHNRHNHGHRRQKWPPSTPHEVLRSAPTLLMDGQQPPKIADVIFWGVEGVYAPQRAPLFRQ